MLASRPPLITHYLSWRLHCEASLCRYYDFIGLTHTSTGVESGFENSAPRCNRDRGRQACRRFCRESRPGLPLRSRLSKVVRLRDGCYRSFTETHILSYQTAIESHAAHTFRILDLYVVRLSRKHINQLVGALIILEPASIFANLLEMALKEPFHIIATLNPVPGKAQEEMPDPARVRENQTSDVGM